MRNLNGSLRLLACGLLAGALSACDAAKKFIDPTGNAYAKPPDTTQKAAAKSPTQTPAAVQPSGNPVFPSGPAPRAHSSIRDVPPLSPHDALVKAGDMLLTTPSGWVEFHKGRAFAKGRQLTLWNEQEVPWGLGIVDLDQDGADDAVLAVRSTGGGDTAWNLAVLVDRDGKLQCIQSILLKGVDGIQSLEATAGGVLVSPPAGPPQLFGWVGGELVGNP